MSLRQRCQPRWLLSALLIAGAALFAIGVAAERHATSNHSESGTEATLPAVTGGETAHTEGSSGEGTSPTEAAGGEAAGGETAGGEAAGHAETSGETVLGVNLESNALVAVAVIVSLALAVLTWLRNRRSVLLIAVGFALVFAVFDVAEVAHQIKESRAGLATFAAVIALVHLASAVVAQQRATATSS